MYQIKISKMFCYKMNRFEWILSDTRDLFEKEQTLIE